MAFLTVFRECLCFSKLGLCEVTPLLGLQRGCVHVIIGFCGRHAGAPPHYEITQFKISDTDSMLYHSFF